MEAAMSVRVNPQWVVPYSTIEIDFQDLLDDFSAYVEVGIQQQFLFAMPQIPLYAAADMSKHLFAC